MKYEDAKSKCHIRSSIYRKSDPKVKYVKNHTIPFDNRIPKSDQFADDWGEYDPNEDYNLSLPAES